MLSAAPLQLTPAIVTVAKATGVHYLDLSEDVANTRLITPFAAGASTASIPLSIDINIRR